jgi:cysteinyl-tRNA synthetase
VFNTLTREKEDFKPRDEGKVGLYVCGPTVYNYIHIGNGRTYLSFDIIFRYLKYRGFDVTYVRNLTDVDDKIINKANEEGTEAKDVAARYSEAFAEDTAGMGLVEPTIVPKATEHVQEMVEIIKGLIEKKMAYEVDGDVYYDVTAFEGYGKLAHRTLEDMRAGERVDIDERKHFPMDFALWKTAKPGEPAWDSPWGRGRPGWHIECTAMSLKYLGKNFDIHGGGRDLIFPHHENEIAQTEAYTGKPFVRYWMHGGMVNIGDEKMAKSLGNVILVRDLLKDNSPMVLRMLALGTHYRSPINFGADKLKEAEAAYERLLNVRRRVAHAFDSATVTGGSEKLDEIERLDRATGEAKTKFVEAMDDDFNSAAAMAALFELVKEMNTFIEVYDGQPTAMARGTLEKADAVLRELAGAVGLSILIPEDLADRHSGIPALPDYDLPIYKAMYKKLYEELPDGIYRLANEVLPEGAADREKEELVSDILERRNRARKEKDWATADKVRNELAQMGIEIEDTPLGSRWKLK